MKPANAVNYPVTLLSDVPAGGWTDEHETDKLLLRKIPAGTCTREGLTRRRRDAEIDSQLYQHWSGGLV